MTGHAASLNGLCVTPNEFHSKVGEFAEYCPVSLARNGELVDCKTLPISLAAEYRYVNALCISLEEKPTMLCLYICLLC